jgi:hypothetical protein
VTVAEIDYARLEMAIMLRAAADMLPTMKWKQEPGPKDHDARLFVGECEGWRAVVTDFDISDQGFPPGTRGYDGAITSITPPMLLHLTRELAQKAVELALQSIGD